MNGEDKNAANSSSSSSSSSILQFGVPSVVVLLILLLLFIHRNRRLHALLHAQQQALPPTHGEGPVFSNHVVERANFDPSPPLYVDSSPASLTSYADFSPASLTSCADFSLLSFNEAAAYDIASQSLQGSDLCTPVILHSKEVGTAYSRLHSTASSINVYSHLSFGVPTNAPLYAQSNSDDGIYPELNAPTSTNYVTFPITSNLYEDVDNASFNRPMGSIFEGADGFSESL